MNKVLGISALKQIEREGERIKNALAQLVSAFPSHARTITGMSNWLEANKSTCQRMVETINKAVDGQQVIHLLPGPAGITTLIDLAESKHVNKVQIQNARKAVIRFENLIYEHSRSHTAFKALIKQSAKGEESHEDRVKTRKKLHDAAAILSGEAVDTIFKLFILRDNPNNPEYLQQYTLHYLENLDLSENARPVMLTVSPCESTVKINKPKVIPKTTIFEGDLPTISIVEDYTSPEITNGLDDAVAGERWIVLPTEFEQRKNINLGVIKNYPHEQLGPYFGGKKASCVSALIRRSTKKLNMLCFLERKYAMRSVANVGIYSTYTELASMITSPDSLWFDRYQDDTDLSLLNATDNFSAKVGHPMASDLVDSLFSLTGCDKKDFSCYLVQVEYPIWSTHYRLYFQYAID